MQNELSLDLARLENVKHLDGGAIRATCPACRAVGSDKSGDHLLIQPGGKFGCATHKDDGEHRKKIFALAGRAKSNGLPAKSIPAFDWTKCVADFTGANVAKLATWRGISVEFVRWLHEQGIVGIFEGKTAIANHGDGGKVISAHVRPTSGEWFFIPKGHQTSPLVFGNTKLAAKVLAFESQWDAFAVMDKFGWHTSNGLPDTSVFITRGAGNGKLIFGQVSPDAVCYAFKQNDAPTAKNPTPAGEIWLADVASSAGCKVLNVATPAPHKDANDWTRAGATDADLRAAMKAARPVQPPAALVADSNFADITGEYLVSDVEQPQQSLIERLDVRIYSRWVKPIEPMPRFFLAGVQVSTAGNLTTISAQAKAGKSAAIAAMIGSTFAASDADCLGFTSENPNGFAVVHLDTEQTPFDHWEGNQRTIRRAKVDTAPAWLRSYCLTGFSAADVRLAIRILTEQAAKQFGGIHSVFVDGIADATPDVNDPAETSSLITELHGLAIQFDCPILNIIHVNPGSDYKTRGHLGSQLERKSESNLRLEKDDAGVSVIWADKNRRAPIPKKTAPRFAWNDEFKMHVSAASICSIKYDAGREKLREQCREAFHVSGKSALSWTDLVKFLRKVPGVNSDRTAERIHTDAKRDGIIIKNTVGQWELA